MLIDAPETMVRIYYQLVLFSAMIKAGDIRYDRLDTFVPDALLELLALVVRLIMIAQCGRDADGKVLDLYALLLRHERRTNKPVLTV